MRPMSVRSIRSPDLRRQFERLGGLPVRPTSARATLEAPVADGDDSSDSGPPHPSTDFDPGWALAWLRGGSNDLAIVAESTWWKGLSVEATEAMDRLWRNAVAVSFAARRLAREAKDPDPNVIARVGLLHRLGLWALAAVDPESLVCWLAATDADRRRELETAWMGTDLSSFSQTLASRWSCNPLLGDAAWLFDDLTGELAACAVDPVRLRFIQQAHSQAEQTPWSLACRPGRDPGPLDPRIRLLMAEVQSRCGGTFVEPDATGREERLTREIASLRLETARHRAQDEGRDRLIAALADSDPNERPEIWAERAGLSWCDTPGVSAARVVWLDASSASERLIDPLPDQTLRIPNKVLPIGDSARPVAEVQLWNTDLCDPSPLNLAAWSAWAELVADRTRLRYKLDAAINAFRRRVEGENVERNKAKLAALGEFAAGAGHELNNPLAVILGRAQLLLGRSDDPETLRSLRAIIVQAQRAHRILRDLMYVARPPEPRPRLCLVDDILRSSVRDAQIEAEARSVRLVGDPRPGPSVKVWADPDSLRHVADVLVRNALEATPSGGTVCVRSSGDENAFRWTVKDNGRGLSAHEATHLFDPFFCGRQAGRGLGLGLPRATRIVERAGGELTWQSTPGQGTSFQLKMPMTIPPPLPDGIVGELPKPPRE